MQVNDALIEKLSRLAMLRFDAEEKEAIKQDLQKMIEFVGRLEELDISGVAPLLHMSKGQNVLREDVPGEMLSPQEALKNASLHDSQFFKVPKVIRKEQ